jgi:NitT/TauT family transport system substrate-binding protein
MTAKGKLMFLMLILVLTGLGIWRWSDKIFPPANVSVPSLTKNDLNPVSGPAGTGSAAPALSVAEVAKMLLAGDKEAKTLPSSSIPEVNGVSAYDKTLKNGKVVVQFPINVWPGWSPIILANNGLDANDESVFYKKYGFYVQLSVVDDPIQARDLFASGHSHVLWGTLDMMTLFAPSLSKDSRSAPRIPMQIDFSAGGDGIVARHGIKSINDLRPVNGVRRKGVLAQYSPSHAFAMSMITDAGVDPAEIDWVWADTAPSAAKIFVTDDSFDFFVGWAPDIYTVPEQMPDARLILTTATANKRIADVFAVRNDFAKDHPEVISGLIKGIFEGMDMVRANPSAGALAISKAFDIPLADCEAMVGKDGSVSTGDAHLTNYRENENFFLKPTSPYSFDVLWNMYSRIYQKLGAIQKPVSADAVKETRFLVEMADQYKDVVDLSQRTFTPNQDFSKMNLENDGVLSKAVSFNFRPNARVLDETYDTNIPANVKSVGEMIGGFGAAYIVIEGNADSSLKGTVPADIVRQFTLDRAQAVKNAILNKFNINPDQLVVKGNGWENPAHVQVMTDSNNMAYVISDDGLVIRGADVAKYQNKASRRVEVKVYPIEGE